MTSIRFRRPVALGLVLSFAFLLAPAGTIAAEPGVVVGRVLATDGVTPLPGVVVSLVDEKSKAVYASAPSSARGTFEAQAPAGDYRVVAESGKGAYLAGGAVRVAAGANPPVALMLQQAAGQEGTATPPPPASTMPTWAKWVIVGGIVVTGGLVVAAVTDDADEPQASPSGGGNGGGGEGK